jgi:hypothetical protein
LPIKALINAFLRIHPTFPKSNPAKKVTTKQYMNYYWPFISSSSESWYALSFLATMNCRIFLVLFLSVLWSARALVDLPLILSANSRRLLNDAYADAVNVFGVSRLELRTQMRALECRPCSRCSNPSKDVRAYCNAVISEGPTTWTCTAQVPESFNVSRYDILMTDYESIENTTGKRPFSTLARGYCTFDYTIVAETDPTLPIYGPECDNPVDPVFLSNNGKLIPGGVCDPFYYERLANLYETITRQQKDDAIATCCRYNYKFFRDGNQRYRICQ